LSFIGLHSVISQKTELFLVDVNFAIISIESSRNHLAQTVLQKHSKVLNATYAVITSSELHRLPFDYRRDESCLKAGRMSVVWYSRDATRSLTILAGTLTLKPT
jgi:hypothetical protein